MAMLFLIQPPKNEAGEYGHNRYSGMSEYIAEADWVQNLGHHKREEIFFSSMECYIALNIANALYLTSKSPYHDYRFSISVMTSWR